MTHNDLALQLFKDVHSLKDPEGFGDIMEEYSKNVQALLSDSMDALFFDVGIAFYLVNIDMFSHVISQMRMLCGDMSIKPSKMIKDRLYNKLCNVETLRSHLVKTINLFSVFSIVCKLWLIKNVISDESLSSEDLRAFDEYAKAIYSFNKVLYDNGLGIIINDDHVCPNLYRDEYYRHISLQHNLTGDFLEHMLKLWSNVDEVSSIMQGKFPSPSILTVGIVGKPVTEA